VRGRRWALAAVAAAAFAAVVAFGLTAGDDGPGAAPRPPERPPVVLLIFDEFPLDAIMRPDGQIDADRFPNWAALARTSTWFPNAHTIYDSTFKAVPAILDARLPQPRTASDIRSHHHSIYTLFDRLGYDVVDVESAEALCPPRICAGARTRRPGILRRLAGSGRPARLNAWIGAIRKRPRPTLYVQHALLPHEPWIYLPSGRQSRPAGNDPIPGINRPMGFDDPELTTHNHQRHLLQEGFVDHEIGRLLARLRRTGLLDRALVVVTADHGYAFEVGADSRREVTESNIDQIAPVPLFVKAPGQTSGRVDPALVRNMDVLPTIAGLLGARLDWRHDGHSAFSSATRARRVVSIPRRDFSRVVSIGADEWLRKRRATRERWARVFGTGAQSQAMFGSPWASVYRIGPHQELLGTEVENARVLNADGVRATVANADLMRRVDPSDRLLPTRVTGRLNTPPGGELRDMAVAVNGRIEAVGRSFRLHGRRPEYFSFMVPEESLRPGANRVEVFEVRRGGALVPL
jgi:hypothetical protein